MFKLLLESARERLIVLYDSLAWILRYHGVEVEGRLEYIPVDDCYLKGRHFLPSVISPGRFNEMYLEIGSETINLISSPVETISKRRKIIIEPISVSSSVSIIR